MPNSSLLPPNTTPLERYLEQLLADTSDLPLSIGELWDPWACPTNLLPWLAWANSVDDWQESWPEKVKRSVIAASFEVHRYKGTPYALQTALNALGIKTDFIEWWEPQGSGQPGTMTITALINNNITDQGEGLINKEMLQLVSRSINKAKRGSIHYQVELGLSLEESLGLALGATYGLAAHCLNLQSKAVLPDAATSEAQALITEHRLYLQELELTTLAILPHSASGNLPSRLVNHQLTLHEHHLTGVQ